ncbi:MAG: hypothetical protein ABIZ04_21680 [Opitutus sp.]
MDQQSRPPEPFRSDATAQLDSVVLHADALSKKVASYATLRTEAELDREARKSAFITSYEKRDAEQYADACRRVETISLATAAIEDSGGPAAAREEMLSTNAVFSLFARGFAERLQVLEGRRKPARKLLADRLAELTESGTPFLMVERDSFVHALRIFEIQLSDEISAATGHLERSRKNSRGYSPMSFDQLYGYLVAPIPQLPVKPAATTPTA